jgi:dimethylsulfone monooxygenase
MPSRASQRGEIPKPRYSVRVSSNASPNPLFNHNRMKLGTFATNCSNGAAATTAEGAFQLSWESTRALAQASDAAGLEAIVPVGRWKGFGGATDFNGDSFEVFTWAAGLAQATSYSAILATSHVPVVHPVLTAKQSATIDHISGGRFGLNIVCGWNPDEFAMFGSGALRSHDDGYAMQTSGSEFCRSCGPRRRNSISPGATST